jgi:hypothetical protein
MWRDVFLNNRDAVLEVLGRFNEDLSQLQRAVRNGDGETLFDWFTRTPAIRRAIIDTGQDVPSFGRLPFQVYVSPRKKRKAAKKKGKVAVAKKKKPAPRKVAKRRRK